MGYEFKPFVSHKRANLTDQGGNEFVSFESFWKNKEVSYDPGREIVDYVVDLGKNMERINETIIRSIAINASETFPSCIDCHVDGHGCNCPVYGYNCQMTSFL